MVGELLIGAVVLALVATGVRRWTASAGRGRPSTPTADRDEPTASTWTAGAVGAAFPLERTPHERDIGDAAFVDGLVIGRYVFPDERVLQHRRGAPRPEAGGNSDRGAGFDGGGGDVIGSGRADDDGEGAFDDGSDPDDDLTVGVGYELDTAAGDGSFAEDDVEDDLADSLDDGFGDDFGDGFDDGFDDGW